VFSCVESSKNSLEYALLIMDVICGWNIASPYWRHRKPPDDVTVDDEEELDIECQAHGRPRPNITWSINGTQVACWWTD